MVLTFLTKKVWYWYNSRAVAKPIGVFMFLRSNLSLTVATLILSSASLAHAGSGTSGGGDRYVGDFLETVKLDLYPLIKKSQSKYQGLVAEELLAAADPSRMVSEERVFESCDGSRKGREVEVCYSSAEDMFHISRAMYPIDRKNSPSKRRLLAHELARRLRLEGDDYLLTSRVSFVEQAASKGPIASEVALEGKRKEGSPKKAIHELIFKFGHGYLPSSLDLEDTLNLARTLAAKQPSLIKKNREKLNSYKYISSKLEEFAYDAKYPESKNSYLFLAKYVDDAIREENANFDDEIEVGPLLVNGLESASLKLKDIKAQASKISDIDERQKFLDRKLSKLFYSGDSRNYLTYDTRYHPDALDKKPEEMSLYGLADWMDYSVDRHSEYHLPSYTFDVLFGSPRAQYSTIDSSKCDILMEYRSEFETWGYKNITSIDKIDLKALQFIISGKNGEDKPLTMTCERHDFLQTLKLEYDRTKRDIHVDYYTVRTGFSSRNINKPGFKEVIEFLKAESIKALGTQ